MDCERCLAIRGPGCASSYQGADGKAICVFCADSVPCPTQLRIAKGISTSPAQTLAALVKQVRGTRDTRKPQEDQMTDTSADTARNCRFRGAGENWPPTTHRLLSCAPRPTSPLQEDKRQWRSRCCRHGSPSAARVRSAASSGGTGEPSPRIDPAGRQTGILLGLASRKKLTTSAINP